MIHKGLLRPQQPDLPGRWPHTALRVRCLRRDSHRLHRSPLLFHPHYSRIDSTVSNQPWGSVDPRCRSPECSAHGFGSSEAHFWMRFSTFAICSVEIRWMDGWMDVISSSLSTHLCPSCSRNVAAVLWSFCDTDRRVHLSKFLLLQPRLGLCALNHTLFPYKSVNIKKP